MPLSRMAPEKRKLVLKQGVFLDINVFNIHVLIYSTCFHRQQFSICIFILLRIVWLHIGNIEDYIHQYLNDQKQPTFNKMMVSDVCWVLKEQHGSELRSGRMTNQVDRSITKQFSGISVKLNDQSSRSLYHQTVQWYISEAQ